MSDIEVLHPDHRPEGIYINQVGSYYWWRKEPKWAKKLLTLCKSTAKLSHIAHVQVQSWLETTDQR